MPAECPNNRLSGNPEQAPRESKRALGDGVSVEHLQWNPFNEDIVQSPVGEAPAVAGPDPVLFCVVSSPVAGSSAFLHAVHPEILRSIPCNYREVYNDCPSYQGTARTAIQVVRPAPAQCRVYRRRCCRPCLPAVAWIAPGIYSVIFRYLTSMAARCPLRGVSRICMFSAAHRLRDGARLPRKKFAFSCWIKSISVSLRSGSW